MKFIPDNAINLAKDSNDSDWLNTRQYVDTLSSCIEESKGGDVPMCIGLFGQWGCGKSTVVETYRETHPDTKVVIYDAWKYSGDSFRRTFLMQLGKELLQKDFDIDKALEVFYANTTEDRKVNSVINACRYDIITKILSVGIIIILFLTVFFQTSSFDSSLTFTSVTQILTLAMLVYMHVKDDLKTSVQTPHMFAPEQFDTYFSKIISQARSNTENKLDKHLVLVIDNLDRCQPEVAYRMLSDIKSFLLVDMDTTFVIPVDDKALEKGILDIKSKDNHEQQLQVKEFLRKLFNFSITFKRYSIEEVDSFAQKLNEHYSLGLKPDTIGLVSNMYVGNPRRIIQLFNNLNAELMLHTEAVKHQTMICHLLILREEFPSFYEKILNDIEQLFTQPASEATGNDDRLMVYLRLSGGLVAQYADHKEDVRLLCSNSSRFAAIPIDVRTNVIQGETSKVLAFYADKDTEGLQQYLYMRIKSAISLRQYATRVTTLLRTYYALHAAKKLNDTSIESLAKLLRDDNHLGEITIPIDEMRNAIDFGKKLEAYSCPALTQFIISLCRYDKSDLLGSNVPWDRIISVKDFFYGCSRWTKDQVAPFASTFAELYKENMAMALAYDYGHNSSTLLTDAVFRDMASTLDYGKSDAVQVITEGMVSILAKKMDAVSNFDAFLVALAANKSIPKFEINANGQGNNTTAVQPLVSQLTQLYRNWTKADLKGFTKSIKQLNEKICISPGVAGSGNEVLLHSYIHDNLTKETIINGFLDYFYYVTIATDEAIISADYLNPLLSTESTKNLLVGKLRDIISAGCIPASYLRLFIATGLTSELTHHYGISSPFAATAIKILVDKQKQTLQDLAPVNSPSGDSAKDGIKQALEELMNKGLVKQDGDRYTLIMK